ncbi:MAG: amidophosphoribosyltransferase [Halanaerobiaceae bacterium]
MSDNFKDGFRREGKPKEECGIFGIFTPDRENVASLIYLGIHALQHRGQEGAGIAVTNKEKLDIIKDNGLVDSVFDEDDITSLKGNSGIGHVRYSTTGSSKVVNTQPLLIKSSRGSLALAHNGNLVNSTDLRLFLEKNGSIFHSTLDTEVIAHLIARSPNSEIEEALIDSLNKVKGAYSLTVLTKDKLIGVRDPRGFRPLVLGKLEESYILASESCALDIIGAELIRDVKPGEMIVIDDDGLHSRKFKPVKENRFCDFEYIYFARPDSNFNGNNVHLVRQEFGRQLAREVDVKDKIDVVVPVLDSGLSAAQGFAEEAGIPFQFGLLKNRYVGRTFIDPVQEIRNLKVRMKLNPMKEIVKGKKVALIDDSIVRGTTSSQLVEMVKEEGAEEVHMFISSPPVTHPCYYGLDTSNRKELIAANNSVEEIREKIGADSLTYLSLEGLRSIMKEKESGCCSACFSGNYPTETGDGKHSLEF